jgi:hypothetical protein
LPRIVNFPQIDAIFIFCSKKDQDEYSIVQDRKIIGIYDQFELLCLSIQERIEFVVKELHTWSFYDQNENATRDLSRQSNDFLWLQLVHDVLSSLSRDEQAKRQMIDACRQYYQGNLKELALIHQFEIAYESKDAIRWYLKTSFLRKMINKALRTEDTNQLYTLRYFLGDLIESLIHQQIMTLTN